MWIGVSQKYFQHITCFVFNNLQNELAHDMGTFKVPDLPPTSPIVLVAETPK